MPLFGSAGWRQPFALTWSDQETGNEQAGPPPKVATCVDASYARAFFGRHFARSRVLTCAPLPDRACLHAREGASDAAFHKSGIPAGVCFCHDCPCWKITRSLPEDPVDRRAFTALFQAELKAQAVLIEKLRPVGRPSRPSPRGIVRDRRAVAAGLGNNRDRHRRDDGKAARSAG